MASVSLQNVSKHFGPHKVIEDLSITIPDGECFTFLGPSGCGKTVLLRLIAGFEQPTCGEIFIGNTLVSSVRKNIHIPPEKRNISVVFQDYAVWPHKTVYENIIYPLKIQKVHKEEATQRTMAAIRDVNLNGLENRLPFQLSGGQQQRVALGRALVSRPEIMLLDEPLSNLDANLREEMRFEIKELQRNSGVTILYVTHDQEVALAISDRMAIIDNNGSIRQVGTPDEIHENPVDSFVFKFLGISNFIPVTYRDGGVYIDDSKVVLDYPISKKRISELQNDTMIAGCRPHDIRLVRDGTATKGVIKRMAYLGSIVDYRIESGGKEIRVQQDVQDVHDEERNGLIFQEGDVVGMKFLELRWFKSQDVEQERS